MTNPIFPVLREHVQELLGDGLLHKQIMQRTGLSRSCVRQIAQEYSPPAPLPDC